MVTLTKKQIKEKRHWTIADYALLPDELRCEIIDGTLYMSPSPRTEHQRVLRKLVNSIDSYVGKLKLGEVFFAPYDVVLDDDEVLQPDLVFVSTKNAGIVKELNVVGAPDLVAEIVSPNSLRHDMGLKREVYEKYGVPEYWIVNPAAKSIEVWVLEKKRYHLHSAEAEKGIVTSRVLAGLKLKIGKVFA